MILRSDTACLGLTADPPPACRTAANQEEHR
jgi:hypothetical protein